MLSVGVGRGRRRRVGTGAAAPLQPARGCSSWWPPSGSARCSLPLHRAAVHPPVRTSTSPCRCRSTCPSRSAPSSFTPGGGAHADRGPHRHRRPGPGVVRFTSWGLAMRAMSENADSARLSGVWVRRTSTLAWTVAGALSAFTAILNAPGQTSALTQVLSARPPALRAHRGARRRHGQPDRRLRRRHRDRGLPRGAGVERHQRRPSVSSSSSSSSWSSCWSGSAPCEGGQDRRSRAPGSTVRRLRRCGRSTSCAAGSRRRRVWLIVVVSVLLPFVLSRRQQSSCSPDLHLCRRRPVPDRAHGVGGPGVARAVRAGGGGRPGRGPPGELLPLVLSSCSTAER